MDIKKTEKKRGLKKALKILAAALAIVAATLAFVFFMHRFELIELPTPIEKLLGLYDGGESVLPGDEGKIYDALKNGTKYDDISVIYDVSAQDKYKLLDQTKEIQIYTFFNTVSFSDGENTKVQTNKIWREYDKYRIETYEKNTLVRLIICDGANVWVTDRSNGIEKTNAYGINDEFTIADQAGTVSLDDFINSETIDTFAASIIRSETDSLWYAELIRSDIPQREHFYVSLKYGIVVNCEIYHDGKLTYKLTTDRISDTLDGYECDYQELFKANE